jgi:TonB family protein
LPDFFRDFADKERPLFVPPLKPFRSGQIPSDSDRDLGLENYSPGIDIRGQSLEESIALSSLKELIATGDHRLDPILATITDAARELTGASGSALAMWKEGAMVCRARSGDPAPILGARLSAETGISGECLRTGKVHHCADTENDPLVDAEVCRTLGLRSIAALPIQGWRGVNGILEVFSTKPAAFTEQNIAVLKQLAALAERARASQPHGASSSTSKRGTQEPQPSGLLPASDRVGDVALAFLGRRARPLVLGVIGVAALSLLALAIWLGWHGSEQTNGKAHEVSPSSVNAAMTNGGAGSPAIPHAPDDDPVWSANPGGEALFASNGKNSAGTPVKFAAKVDVLPEKKPSPGRSLLLDYVAPNIVISYRSSGSQVGSGVDARSDSHSELRSDDLPPPDSHPAEAHPDGPSSGSQPSGPSDPAKSSGLNGILSAKVTLPALSVPVSTGVTGGQLVHRVPPVYPAQARLLRLEGTVIVSATVMEDGTVRDVKVVQGAPVLAQSAVNAVKYWRYKPYELDGKPVKNDVVITVDFKFPSDATSR